MNLLDMFGARRIPEERGEQKEQIPSPAPVLYPTLKKALNDEPGLYEALPGVFKGEYLEWLDRVIANNPYMIGAVIAEARRRQGENNRG